MYTINLTKFLTSLIQNARNVGFKTEINSENKTTLVFIWQYDNT